jgi:hypothetical protein
MGKKYENITLRHADNGYIVDYTERTYKDGSLENSRYEGKQKVYGKEDGVKALEDMKAMHEDGSEKAEAKEE